MQRRYQVSVIDSLRRRAASELHVHSPRVRVGKTSALALVEITAHETASGGPTNTYKSSHSCVGADYVASEVRAREVASGTGCRLTIFSRRRLDAMSVRTAVVADLRTSANEVEVSRILYSGQAGFCDVEPLLFLKSTYYADCDGGGGNNISALECTDRLPRRYSSGTPNLSPPAA
jgi:hypothetical protein